MNLNIVITKNNAGQRLDRFLVEVLNKESAGDKISRADLARAVKNGKILTNNKKVKPSYILKKGDKVIFSDQEAVMSNQKKESLIPNPEVEFEVIFKDENIIVVDKPAGLQVHPVKPTGHGASPNSKEQENTLVNGLIAKFPEIKNVGEDLKRPGMVHRLDKDTSGVIVVARNQKSFEELKKLFKNRKIKKKYLAVVYGKLKNKNGVIEKPIARAGNYKKQTIAGRKTKTKIRQAITKYKVLQEFKNYSLVEARLITGRTHQIRIHFFSLGHPVIGDKIYKIKGKSKFNQLKTKRQLLHASQIEFKLLGKKYSFSSPLPSDFNKFLNPVGL